MKSIEELIAIRDRMQSEIVLREEANCHARIIVSMGTVGLEAGARDVLKAFVEAVTELGLAKDVMVTQRGTVGVDNALAAIVRVTGEEDVVYVDLTAEKARRIVEEHVRDGKPVVEYTINK